VRSAALFVALASAWSWGVGCRSGGTRDPLPADEAPPLRLSRARLGSPADNSRCEVCHVNFSEELIAVSHAEQGLGCETCHGVSDDHAGDEGHQTAPDIIYAREVVKPFCMGCHDAKSLGEWDEHEEILAAASSSKETCTDCHGEHRLRHRGVHWDKRTKRIIPPNA